MKVLLDVNVVVDIITRRQAFYKDSYEVFNMVAEKKIIGIIDACSIANVYYFARKEFSSSKLAQAAVLDLLYILLAVDTKAQDIYTAANLGFSDFEDAVISAVAFRENADFIITRNEKDFAKSLVKAISPSDFLLHYRF